MLLNTYTIEEPMWNCKELGGQRAVSIADYRFAHYGYVNLKIGYKNKKGKYLYPDTYRITKEKALQYPVITKGKIGRAYYIPIKDLLEWVVATRQTEGQMSLF